MVKDSTARYYAKNKSPEKDFSYLPEPLKYTTVTLKDVINNKNRLEASAFNLDAKYAINKVKSSRYGYVFLLSDKGLISEANHRPRFKRIFLKKSNLPIYQPSAITEVYPKPTKYISDKTDTNIDSLKVKKGMLLMTVSGTIGKCSIVGSTLDNKIFSHDLLRIIGKGPYDIGYIYAFFNTKIGQLILQTNNYGAVVQHIEPEHLESVIIPNAPENIKKEIHDLIIESYDLRDKSNYLIDQAEKLLYEELKLPPIENIKPKYYDYSKELKTYTTKLSELNLRLDSSYHTPITRSIYELINKNSNNVKFIKDEDISKSIILPGRFKRTYVESEEYGIKFIGGKQINDLIPSSEKFLSHEIHKTRLGQELLLKENCILITRSGTIGKVTIVPHHWENWAANEHIIRVFPVSNDIAGYLFCWLNTEYGLELIKKHTYGAVVDEIDTNHVGDIPLPLCDPVKQMKINNLILEANSLRYQAYLKENEALVCFQNIFDS